MIKPMGKGDLFMEMGMSTLEIGLKTRHMALEYIHILMELPIQESGAMISKMAMEFKPGLTRPAMKAVIKKGKSKGKASSCGLMAPISKGTSKIITSMGKVLK